MTAVVSINSPEDIQPRLIEGRIPRYGPMLMLFARSAFILLAQGLLYLFFKQLDIPNAEVEIRNWWPVYGTLVDGPFECFVPLSSGIKQKGLGS